MVKNIFQSDYPVAKIKMVHVVVHINETAEKTYVLHMSEKKNGLKLISLACVCNMNHTEKSNDARQAGRN